MFSFNYFYDHPIQAMLLWVDLIYFLVNFFKFINAKRAGDLPRKTFYSQLFKGNLCLVFSGICSGTMGASSPGSSLWLLAGLWYVCTPWWARKQVTKRLEAARAVEAQAAAAARQNTADANVWPPPPQA